MNYFDSDRTGLRVTSLNQIHILLLAGLALLLVACGGGGGPPPNQSPTANAGADQTVDEQTTITLSGSGADTDGSIASYSWTQVSGTGVTLIGSNTATASSTAPDINADETLTFQLTVTDNEGVSANDTVVILVIRVNQPPTANAGPDQTVDERTTVTLSGSGTDTDGSIASYSWTQVSGTGVTLIGSNTATASFTASDISADETLTFQLIVIDNEGASASDNISIVRINQSPIGGTVSGLVGGTLLIQNNNGTMLSFTSNVSYVFPEQFGNGDLYQVSIVQNPAAQICSISNASGQINVASVTNIDIFCSATGTLISLSGSYQAAPSVLVDSDVNDPFAAIYIDNGFFSTAQVIPNFSTIHGFATKFGTTTTTNTDRAAFGDRFASTPDEFDVYRVVLQNNQSLNLQVINFFGGTSGDLFEGDLDLALYDLGFNLIAASFSVTEFEDITVPADGEYYVAVNAFDGTSKYTLVLNAVSPLSLNNSNSMDFKPGEAIIQFNSNSAINSFLGANNTISLSHNEINRAALASFDLPDIGSLSLSGADGSFELEQELAQNNPDSFQKFTTLQQIKHLNRRQDVEFAEPNYILQPSRVPDDQHYNFQWHYPAINLPQAWDLTTGSRAGSDVIVAVADTGVFLAHPEFTGQLVNGYDFIRDTQMSADGDGIDANPDDPGDSAQIGSSSWHGTHVAGTVAASSNNTSGVAGAAWGAKIMPVRVLGVGGGTGYDVIQGILYAAGLSNDSNTVPAQKADIINLSLGGGSYSQSSQNAYNAARAEGVIVVAAAGNDNTSQLSYPASYDGVVSVSATDFVNNRAPYSNFGSRVDVAAPGGNTGVDLNNDTYADGVLSTLVDDSSGTRNPTYVFYAGTSMATPHVAGVFALMRAVHPTLSPDDIDNLLSSGAITTDLGDVGRDDVYGHGLIDALKAVQEAQQLANGGTNPVSPALIVATPNQFTMGLDVSATLVLSNQGGLSDPVISFSADASWLSITAIAVDANGLGDYLIEIDRTGLVASPYLGSITFNLASGGSLNVQVSMQVGVTNSTGDVGQIYMLLLDANFSTIDQVAAIDQGNGVFNYSFNGVAAGSYFIVGGSDIDNDFLICQLAEACGGYPIINALNSVEAINVNIIGLDFIIDILANFDAASLSVDESLNSAGFQRQSIDGKLFE